jgi:hypothetical protein
MKRYFGFLIVLVLGCAPAFAVSDSQSVSIASPVKIGSTQLAAGTYKVSWTGAGSNVQVTLVKNGKTVATVPAKMVSERNQYSGVSTQTQGGAQVLQAIQLNTVTLVLSETAHTSTGQ